jgi:hypothetical protein
VVRRHEGRPAAATRPPPTRSVARWKRGAARLRAQRRAVALVADDDDPLVEARDGRVVVPRRRIDRPLEDVRGLHRSAMTPKRS